MKPVNQGNRMRYPRVVLPGSSLEQRPGQERDRSLIIADSQKRLEFSGSMGPSVPPRTFFCSYCLGWQDIVKIRR